MRERVRIHKVETLSDDWYVLKKTTFDLLRSDGTWQRQSRETYDRGNGATILLYNLAQQTVVLTRQFRFPAFVNGHSGLLVEAAAGLLDESTPEDRIKVEVEEETGYRIDHVRKIFEAFMSPGSVTERLYFFVAEYDGGARATPGGALRSARRPAIRRRSRPGRQGPAAGRRAPRPRAVAAEPAQRPQGDDPENEFRPSACASSHSLRTRARSGRRRGRGEASRPPR